jgi:hypothetical protein
MSEKRMPGRVEKKKTIFKNFWGNAKSSKKICALFAKLLDTKVFAKTIAFSNPIDVRENPQIFGIFTMKYDEDNRFEKSRQF